jgi:hypothetical protein
MSATTTVMGSSASVDTGRAFWERLWRMAGFNSVAFFIIAYFIYGNQPGVGASPDALVAFYHGHGTRILISMVFSCQAVLYLMWFAVALRNTLVEVGQEGWASAVIASSAVVGALLFLRIAVGAALAYSIAGSANSAFTSGLNDLAWACAVFDSLPRAMLIMACSFGLWRAGLIPNPLFAAGVAAVVLGVAGCTTLVSGGFWAMDGAYSRFIWPLVGLVWLAVFTRVLSRLPAARSGW